MNTKNDSLNFIMGIFFSILTKLNFSNCLHNEFFLNLELNFLESKSPLNVNLTKDKEGQKKDSPIKNTDESSLVDRIIELSDLKLGFIEVYEYLGMD